MNPENVNENTQTPTSFGGNVNPEVPIKKKKKLLLPFLLFVLFLILGIGFYLFTQTDILDFEKPFVSKGNPATGEIYLTLSPYGEVKPNIYKLDLSTMEMEEYFKNSEDLNFMSKFTPDLGLMAFIRGYEDMTSQLVWHSTQGESSEILEITSKSEVFLRNPVFSSSGDLLTFWFNGNDVNIGESPEDHDIVVIYFDPSGELVSEKVAQGVYPVFSKDGDYLLYLKNDGLYTLNSETREEKLVIEIMTNYMDEEQGQEIYEKGFVEHLPRWASIRFAYCRENERLLLLSTFSSSLEVFKITSWEEFAYEELLSAEESDIFAPNWPVFSPDGAHFVLQNFDHEAGGLDSDLKEGDPISYISVFDLDSLLNEKEKNEKVVLSDFLVHNIPLIYKKTLLDGSYEDVSYDPNYIWVTDWIN